MTPDLDPATPDEAAAALLLMAAQTAADEAPAEEPPVAEHPPIEALPEPMPSRPTLTPAQILADRLDVAWSYEHLKKSDPGHAGASAEDYAKLWFDRHGRFEGYAGEASGEGGPVSLAKILDDRPDVLKAFYAGFYDGGAHARPDEWVARVGGKTAEDYARYWYDRYGKWEGYGQAGAGERLDIGRLLMDRPDVVAEYHAARDELPYFYVKDWVAQVGGDGVYEYAKHWYNQYGKWEGYAQPHVPAPAPEPAAEPEPVPDEGPIEVIGAPPVMDEGIV